MNIQNTNQIKILVAVVTLILAPVLSMHAATNIVLNSDNLQQAINSAAPGDTLILQPGTYTANVVFPNPVTVVRGSDPSVPNEPVNLAGTVQIQGNGASTFQQIFFLNYVTIQITNVPTSATVSLISCQFNQSVASSGANLLIQSNLFQNPFTVDISQGSQTNLQAYDTTFFYITINGGKALLKRCNLTGSYTYNSYYNASIGLTNTVFECIRTTLNQGIIGTAPTNTPFTLVQSTNLPTRDAPIQLTGYNVWMGYNNIDGTVWLHDCNSVLIGNIVVETGDNGVNNVSLQCDNGGTVQAYNNVFSDVNGNAQACYLSLGTNGGYAIMVNNTFIQYQENRQALYADNAFPVTLLGDVFYGNIAGPSALWNISYCVYNQTGITPGTPPGGFGSQQGVALNLVAYSANSPGYPAAFYPNPGSPLITNGPPQSVYNDAGTTNRNTVGYTGGPNFNLANYTNTAPTVYLLTGAPLIFPQGRTNIISINVAGVAGN